MTRYYQILISAGIGLVLPNISHASFTGSSQQYVFSTVAGSTDAAGESVSAQASFDISSDSMVVTLVNLQTGIDSVGQNISSVFFSLNNCGSVLSLSQQNLTGSGTDITIGTGGVVTNTRQNASLDSNSGGHWQLSSSGDQVSLNDLSGGGSPDQTVIGPSDSSNDYSSVNRSIYDNAPHNPFVQNEAKFTVKFPPGLLGDNVKISDVKIGFGTQSGDNKNCYARVALPEPGTLPLLVIGAAAFGLFRRSRQRKTFSDHPGFSPFSFVRGQYCGRASRMDLSSLVTFAV